MSPLHFISICWLSPPWNSNSAAKLVSATVCSCCTVLSVQLLPIRLHFMRVLNWNCCFFVWLCQTFSFQRRRMHQNIIAKVFWSCTFSPCIIGKKTKKKKRLMMKFCICCQRPATHHTSSTYWQPKNRWHSYFSYLSHIGHVTRHETFFRCKLPLVRLSTKNLTIFFHY